MPKIAVYYIPEPNTEFYKLGSSILGYDIRTDSFLQTNAKIKSALGEIDESWISNARRYGFHLTISPPFNINLSDLYKIETELISILKCFPYSDTFTLHKCNDNFIPDWGLPIVLRYKANDSLNFLHALLVSRINTFGIGSSYLERYIESPEEYGEDDHKIYKTIKFFNPFVLTDYLPHFAVFNPYTGNNRLLLIKNLTEIFGSFTNFEIGSICMMIQHSDSENWKIYKEFKVK